MTSTQSNDKISKAGELGRKTAEEDFRLYLGKCLLDDLSGKEPTAEIITNYLLNDYAAFSQIAGSVLHKSGLLFISERDSYIQGYEKSSIYKIYKSAYIKEVINLFHLKSRKYLRLPFAEKDEAKKIGGIRWDSEKKLWYVPFGVDASPFAKWLE